MKRLFVVAMIVFSLTTFLCSCGEKNEVFDNNDNTIGNSDTIVQSENRIETPYFYIDFPDLWKDKFVFSLSSDGKTLTVSMITKRDRAGAHLFTLYVYPAENSKIIREHMEFNLNLVGTLENYNERFIIGIAYASELSCEPDEEEKFIELYDSIPDVLKNLKPVEEYEFKESDDLLLLEFDAPYIDTDIDIIGRSLESYKNQTGSIYEIKNDILKNYYLDYKEGISYYMDYNGALIGTENNDIVSYSVFTDSLSMRDGVLSVRDTLNTLELEAFFDQTPKLINIEGTSMVLLYWKVNNGFLGMITFNGNPSQSYFDYYALQLVTLNDLELLNFI